jgi:DNA primase
MITQKTINEVIAQARIEEVVNDFVNLKRRGVNLIGNCPFHDEKTPSFNVNPSRNIYKCFGCGVGGDPVKFIMEHEKLSFPEAIKFLAQKYRIEIEETVNTAEELQTKQLNDSLYIVNEYAKDFYSDNLWNRQEGKSIGLSYFKERGFREATIKKWNLGYALEERDEFTRIAIEKKYNIEHLRALGLTSASGYDFFRSRVMFPIHNVSGKVVAFGGRTLSADKKIPKYINSSESEIYNKRAVLYGLYFAKDAIRKQDECILVEGYTDVISLHQSGIENVVAASGTSLTTEQIRLIKRYTPNIKMIFDGDAAGVRAALRGMDLVLEADMNVKLVMLPDKEDPDSYLTSVGPQNFNDFLDSKAEDFVMFKTKTLLKDVGDDPIKKTGVIKDVVGSIAKIPDAFKRAVYIRQCSNLLELSEQILVTETNKLIRADQKHKRLTQLPNDGTDPDAESEKWLKPEVKLSQDQGPIVIFNDAYIERDICRILICYGHELYDEEQKVTIKDFLIANVEDFIENFDIGLYRKIIELFKTQTDINSTFLIHHEDKEIQNFAIDVLATPYSYAKWDEKEMFLQTQVMPEINYVKDSVSAVLRFQLKKSENLMLPLKLKLESKDSNYLESEEYIIDIKVMQHLVKQRNEIAGQLRTVTL